MVCLVLYLSKSIEERLWQGLTATTLFDGVLAGKESGGARFHVEGGAQLGDEY